LFQAGRPQGGIQGASEQGGGQQQGEKPNKRVGQRLYKPANDNGVRDGNPMKDDKRSECPDWCANGEAPPLTMSSPLANSYVNHSLAPPSVLSCGPSHSDHQPPQSAASSESLLEGNTTPHSSSRGSVSAQWSSQGDDLNAKGTESLFARQKRELHPSVHVVQESGPMNRNEQVLNPPDENEHEMVSNIQDQVESVSNANEQVEMVSNIQDQVESVSNANEQVEMVSNIIDQVEIVSNVHEKVEMVSNVHDQVEMVLNVQDQVEMVSNVHDQVEMVSNFHHQIEMVSNVHDEVEMVLNVLDQVESVSNVHDHVESVSNVLDQVESVSIIPDKLLLELLGRLNELSLDETNDGAHELIHPEQQPVDQADGASNTMDQEETVSIIPDYLLLDLLNRLRELYFGETGNLVYMGEKPEPSPMDQTNRGSYLIDPVKRMLRALNQTRRESQPQTFTAPISDHLNETGPVSDHLNEIGPVSDHLTETGLVSDHLNETGLISDHLNETGLVSDHLNETGPVSDNLNETGPVSNHLNQNRRELPPQNRTGPIPDHMNPYASEFYPLPLNRPNGSALNPKAPKFFTRSYGNYRVSLISLALQFR